MSHCPTCSQPTDANAEALVQARIATRPNAGPAQARHIAALTQERQGLLAWLRAKCTIAGCWKSKYERLAATAKVEVLPVSEQKNRVDSAATFWTCKCGRTVSAIHALCFGGCGAPNPQIAELLGPALIDGREWRQMP